MLDWKLSVENRSEWFETIDTVASTETILMTFIRKSIENPWFQLN